VDKTGARPLSTGPHDEPIVWRRGCEHKRWWTVGAYHRACPPKPQRSDRPSVVVRSAMLMTIRSAVSAELAAG
jgi:hypothetical protein